jgi:hypothetical protein
VGGDEGPPLGALANGEFGAEVEPLTVGAADHAVEDRFLPAAVL